MRTHSRTILRAGLLCLMTVLIGFFDASAAEKNRSTLFETIRTAPVNSSTETAVTSYEYQNLLESTPNKSAADLKIGWRVLTGGGIVNGASPSYLLSGALNQTAAGNGSSGDFIVRSGFWQPVPDGNMSCCDVPGDANGDGASNVGDAVFIISNVFKNGPDPDCMEKGDANGDCLINVGDAVFLINMCFNDGRMPVCNCRP